MNNIKIPSRDECLDILTKNKTPSNVIEHCKAVCRLSEEVADNLIADGIKVNKKLVIAAALLHDVERIKENHVKVGAKLIKSLGFPEVAKVMVRHSMYQIEDSKNIPKTVEEKIVFYADKRALGGKIVSLKERFDDTKKRYNIDFSQEFKFAIKIEEELVR